MRVIVGITFAVLLSTGAHVATAQGNAAAVQDNAAAADTLPTVTLPADLDRVLRDYEAGWRARDAKALADLFTADGFVLSGGRQPVRGRDAVQARYEGQGGPLHLRAIAYATEDSVGYIVGTYGGTPAMINEGKFILLLRRAPGGRWLIAADMDNPSVPMRLGPPPGQPE